MSEDSDNVRWAPGGESPSQLLCDLIICADDSIAVDIIEFLGSEHSREIFDGDFDYYDDTSDIYEVTLPDDSEHRNTWLKFCESLKHRRRFFSEDARKILHEMLGPVLKGHRSRFANAIKTIGPQDDTRFIYRGRMANDGAARSLIYRAPIRELGPPPPSVSVSGRMNSAGISVFYGSSNQTTCVAELRVPVGGSAVVGKFEIIRPLRLLDITKLDEIQNPLSYFHPRFFHAHSYSTFIRGFHSEIKKAVIPGHETLEYIPTQVVAEYLWTLPKNPVDGLIFGSSQISGEHTNIVLFPHACAIEGASREEERAITRVLVLGDLGDDGQFTEHALFDERATRQADPMNMPARLATDWYQGERERRRPNQRFAY